MSHSYDLSETPFGCNHVGQLLEKYRPWSRIFVRQFLQGKIGRRIDESDIIQMTWLDVVKNIEQFNGETEAEFFGWLKAILNNNLKNVIRDNKAELRDIRKEHDFAVEMDSASIHWWEPVAPGSSPSNRLIKGEQAISLAAAVEALPDRQRQAVILRHLEGKKLSEVTEEMDTTADAVVSLLRRGMQNLKSELDSD